MSAIVDDKDFDMAELRILQGDGDDIDGAGLAAAFESIFDDDMAAEASKATFMRHKKTA